jgi:hypothetical protein
MGNRWEIIEVQKGSRIRSSLHSVMFSHRVAVYDDKQRVSLRDPEARWWNLEVQFSSFCLMLRLDIRNMSLEWEMLMCIDMCAEWIEHMEVDFSLVH